MAEAAPAAPAAPAPAEGTPSAPAAVEPKVDAKPVAEQPKPVEEKITIKVNGKLRTMSRDDAVRELQKSQAARENFEKAAQKEKRVATLMKALGDEGQQLDALKQLGVDPEKIAERLLAERAKRAQMTPEQQKIAELEAQLQHQQKEQQTAQERAEAERQEMLDRQVWAQMEQEYIAEIDRATKAGELPGVSAAEVLYMMADAAEMNLAYGLDLKSNELIAEVKQRVADAKSDLQTKVIGSMDGGQLLDFLGTDVVNKIVRAAAAKYKAGQPIQPLSKPAPIAEQEEKQPRKWVRPSDLKTPWM